MAFLAAVIGCGYLGYEAGLPADDDADDAADGNVTTGGILIHSKPHTKGEEWLEASSRWVANEKEMIRDRRPHWNFPRNKKFNKGTFKPMSQVQLLKLIDEDLLADTCSVDNIATLDGIRDCNALCQHRLCCFSNLESDSCLREYPGECQSYEPCRTLVDGPKDATPEVASEPEDFLAIVKNDDSDGGGGAQEGQPSAEVKDDDSAIASTVQAVCGLGDKLPKGDDSWVVACHALCANYLCCFSIDGQSNCRDSYGDLTCDAYGGCAALVSEEEGPHRK
ncbi:hypothetical protein ACHAW5_006925 [Stephanodiscus triporus]|uniref:Uncharacterized protein n=1 Tax=Stephanodiscus triporus TaxID=2934178 RepID=A0ABD3MP41_9STRA